MGSYDPNDITARTTLGSRTDYILNADEDIVYTIRFQNTGNFPAQNVYILDTLSELLDMARIEIIGASHAFSASYLDGRTLRFDFPNIQLPDSTNDEPNSHGFVSYRILPVSTLAIGDVIENTAAIYFDFNPAVITNTSVVTVQTIQHVDMLAPSTINVFPNPARSEVRVLRNGLPVEIKQGSIIAADGRLIPLASGELLQGVINVGHLATGVYVLDLVDVNGVAIRTRLVRDH
ncbi:MAG: T9SS type A sorting domain-containing protein [Flavobacteriales bacterium]|nr:T9SS type A sorting domain-containing protein [Flavobacteriales bacterium]